MPSAAGAELCTPVVWVLKLSNRGVAKPKLGSYVAPEQAQLRADVKLKALG